MPIGFIMELPIIGHGSYCPADIAIPKCGGVFHKLRIDTNCFDDLGQVLTELIQ